MCFIAKNEENSGIRILQCIIIISAMHFASITSYNRLCQSCNALAALKWLLWVSNGMSFQKWLQPTYSLPGRAYIHHETLQCMEVGSIETPLLVYLPNLNTVSLIRSLFATFQLNCYRNCRNFGCWGEIWIFKCVCTHVHLMLLLMDMAIWREFSETYTSE